MYTATTTTTAGGTYQIDWSPGADLQARDEGYALYMQDAAHLASVRFAAPFLRVEVNGSEITGIAAPLQEVTIEVRDADGTLQAEYQTYSNVSGYFYKDPCVPESHCFDRRSPDDRVTVSAGGQTFSMTLTTLTALADRESGLVSGQALPDQAVTVMRFQGPLT